MRSTEASGVRAEKDDSFSIVRRFLSGVSPFSVALAIAALVSAAIFVVSDITHTALEVSERNAIVAHLAAAQPLLSRQFTTNSLDPVMGETDGVVAAGTVAQRGGIAFGLALLATILGYRRRPTPMVEAGVPDLIATIPFGVACWTAEGRMIVCNDQYRARLGVEPHDVRQGISYSASVKRLIEGGYMQMVREDDRSRILELHREDGSCLLIDERPLAAGGFVTLVTDVTQSRRTDDLLASIREEQRILGRRYHEEKLKAEAASRSKTSFLAHLSHDIRTPLNAIIGFAEMMRHETYGPLGDARYAGYVESIKTSGERLLGFFASILDLAELEGGRRVLAEHEVDVDDMVIATTRRFSAQAQRARIALTLGVPCGALLIGDRFSLERMLGNLVDNAVRFTPAGGKVTVAAYAAEDGVVLEVTDTGIGIAPERLASLSQPFAFSDATLTKDREGAGLGIAIARTIVELSGGHLAIDSRPGLGTTVAVSLPLRQMEQRSAA